MSAGATKTVTCVDVDGKKYQVPADELHWRPAAYGIVIKDGKLLTAKHFGRHNLPGGGLELGETPEEAVVREVKEETGIDVANPRIVSAASQFFKLPYPDPEGEFCESILMYFVCDFVGGEFSMDGFDEAEKIYAEMPEWYPLSKIDELQYASSHDWRPIIKKMIGRGNRN